MEAQQGDDSFPRGSLGSVVAGVCTEAWAAASIPLQNQHPWVLWQHRQDPSGASPAQHPLARQGDGPAALLSAPPGAGCSQAPGIAAWVSVSVFPWLKRNPMGGRFWF